MCQIDVLQRLKCERHIVKKALEKLPSTLDETYDRILLSIPEDERLFVHHVLRWIAYHNELHHGDGIPCGVLIQAVEASILELTGRRNERFYNIDTLREVCGCLINISPKNHLDILGNIRHTYLLVTFAHYTVREYLDSGHDSNGSSACHTDYEGDLKEHFIKITLSEAQRIKQNGLWELETDVDYPNVFEVVESDFNSYCMVSALLSLYKLPGQIYHQGMLRALVIDLLDPTKPHFETMKLAVSTLENAMDIFGSRDFLNEEQWWSVQWHPETSTEAVHLYHLLLLIESRKEYIPLVKTFLQEKDRKGLLQDRLRFEVEGWYSPITGYMKSYTFDGSPIEVFAQRAITSVDAIKVLMEVGAGLFDPSMILLLFIGCHNHSPRCCKGFCPVERLLKLGANPNLTDYKVMPLQIATFLWDLEGVSILLNAGAHPNYTGSSNGVAWEEDTLMSHFNFLHGASPLCIHRHYIDNPFEHLGTSREENYHKIEALLLQYGAEEICNHSTDSSPLTSSSTIRS